MKTKQRRHPSGATRDMLTREELTKVVPELSLPDYKRTLEVGNDEEEDSVAEIIAARVSKLRAMKIEKVRNTNTNNTAFEHTVDPAIIGCDTH